MLGIICSILQQEYLNIFKDIKLETFISIETIF